MRLKPIKIAIDARFMLRPLRGIPLYVYRLCQYLPQIAPDMDFYYLINSGFEHNDSAENVRGRLEWIGEHCPNVQIVDRQSDGDVVWEQYYLPQMLRTIGADLIHMPANRICFNSQVPTVVTLHDTMEFEYLRYRIESKVLHSGEGVRSRFYHARMIGYSVLNYRMMRYKADCVITVSKASLREIHSRLKVPVERIQEIYHGLDDDFACLEPLRIEQRDCVLMFGGDSIHKNPEAAISAWSMLPIDLRAKFRLKIIGFCGSQTSPLLRAVRQHGIEDEVEIRGWVSGEDVVQNFQHARAFLYLSRNEGFGFPLIHAMAAGTPVVASDRGSIPEVLGGLGLTYHPDDHAGIAGGLERLLTDEAYWQEQSETAHLRSRQFTWERSVQMHAQLYRSLVKGPETSGRTASQNGGENEQ
jgi:glycosyltransferase involved in cell wall biosynthesis